LETAFKLERVGSSSNVQSWSISRGNSESSLLPLQLCLTTTTPQQVKQTSSTLSAEGSG